MTFVEHLLTFLRDGKPKNRLEIRQHFLDRVDGINPGNVDFLVNESIRSAVSNGRVKHASGEYTIAQFGVRYLGVIGGAS